MPRTMPSVDHKRLLLQLRLKLVLHTFEAKWSKRDRQIWKEFPKTRSPSIKTSTSSSTMIRKIANIHLENVPGGIANPTGIRRNNERASVVVPSKKHTQDGEAVSLSSTSEVHGTKFMFLASQRLSSLLPPAYIVYDLKWGWWFTVQNCF
ncbi:hypothetical protein Tco_1154498 [Tanacetum coccineum]